MENLHKTQLAIISKLIFSKGLRYTDLKPSKDMENNTFQFHLDSLIKNGYIEKSDMRYRLTKEGKMLATRIDTDTKHISKQAKLGAALGCIRDGSTGKEILVYTRRKQDYYGCQGLPAGKVKLGEQILSAAQRELTEETGLSGIPELAGIIHYHIRDQETQELLDDLLLFVCRFENPKGKVRNCREGEYEWVSISDLQTFIKKPYQTIESFLNEVNLLTEYDGKPKFIEVEFYDNTKF